MYLNIYIKLFKYNQKYKIIWTLRGWQNFYVILLIQAYILIEWSSVEKLVKIIFLVEIKKKQLIFISFWDRLMEVRTLIITQVFLVIEKTIITL